MKIAIQGEAGSFHDEASQILFGPDITLVACENFRDVFAAVSDSVADAGLVAVENSLYGSLHETYDMIARYKFPIIGEVSLAIRQQLIGFPCATKTEIDEIYSHPAALDQCRNYLETNFPDAELIEHYDTAAAVEHIKSAGLLGSAAIASNRAAELHNMQVLDKNIEDEAENITRFVAISPTSKPSGDANKAALVVTTKHNPGALYEALGVFQRLGANLTKLESRPIRGEAFKYQFIIDTLADNYQITKIQSNLESQGCSVTLLGHYKSS
ncbi:prephenate dehydratase [Candidatus Saccharibacteria bacterium]|nr:prephenate dehydratase [Candidatus Saccharibacteria bacterium]